MSGGQRENLEQAFSQVRPVVSRGWVTEVCGPVVRACLNGAAVGDMVEIRLGRRLPGSKTLCARAERSTLAAQVVGFDARTAVLSPLGPSTGLFCGAEVELCSSAPRLRVGAALLGCVLDSGGRVIGGAGNTGRGASFSAALLDLNCAPPAPLERKGIDTPFATGIRAIDAFVTLGRGQRLAVFAEPGVGKSTLVSMIARYSEADVNVIGLIGERGREVGDFVERALSEEGRARTVVVASTSAEPPACRINAALCATRIAEYFRDQGKDVLLQIDSLTRLVRAYREVGLAAGEVPVRRGYPPSVFSSLPSLIERAGSAARGSITALYTVLLSSDIDEDPMVEEIRGLTDGHLMLSRKAAEQGRYPAVDIVRSISRVAAAVLPPDGLRAAAALRAFAARAEEQREILQLSAGTSEEAAKVLAGEEKLNTFLAQGAMTKADYAGTIAQMCSLAESLTGH